MILSCVSNKGGIGKSTIALNLAVSLAILNKKTLIIDLDALGGAMFDFNKSYEDVKNHTIWDVLNEKTNLSDCVINLNDKLDMLCSSTILKRWDDLVNKDINLNNKLIYLLNYLSDIYEFVIIDTSPQMSSLNELIIKNSNLLVIPFIYKQKDLFGTFSTISIINSFNLSGVTKLLVQNCAKSNALTNELKLTKSELILNESLNKFLLSLDNKEFLISKNFINNSSLLDKVAIYKELPLTAIESNAKPIKKIKDQFNALANEIISFKK